MLFQLHTILIHDIKVNIKLSADIQNLCEDASMAPIRDSIHSEKETTTVRPLSMDDFESSLKKISITVSLDEITKFEQWNKDFGYFRC